MADYLLSSGLFRDEPSRRILSRRPSDQSEQSEDDSADSGGIPLDRSSIEDPADQSKGRAGQGRISFEGSPNQAYPFGKPEDDSTGEGGVSVGGVRIEPPLSDHSEDASSGDGADSHDRTLMETLSRQSDDKDVKDDNEENASDADSEDNLQDFDSTISPISRKDHREIIEQTSNRLFFTEIRNTLESQLESFESDDQQGVTSFIVALGNSAGLKPGDVNSEMESHMRTTSKGARDQVASSVTRLLRIEEQRSRTGTRQVYNGDI